MKNEKHDLNVKTDIGEQDIMIDYLKGSNAELQKNETEQRLMDDPFISDAIDGLYGKLNDQELNSVQHKLNKFITHGIRNQRSYAKKTLSFPLWIILLLVVLLFISFAGYILVRYLLN